MSTGTPTELVPNPPPPAAIYVFPWGNSPLNTGFGLSGSAVVQAGGDKCYYSNDPLFSDISVAQGSWGPDDPAQVFDDRAYVISDPAGTNGSAILEVTYSGGTSTQDGAATGATGTLGNVVGKIGVYGDDATLLGWQPIYDNIT
jgi:hypothetical protein